MVSLNYEIKSLNGISLATDITQRLPPPWSQSLPCLSSLGCSVRSTCMQAKRWSRDRSFQHHR